MSEKKEPDFVEVQNRVEQLEKFILRDMVDPMEIANSNMREGYLFIATKANTESSDGALGVKQITVTGGYVDPVMHQLAKVMLKQPFLYARLVHWMNFQRTENEHLDQLKNIPKRDCSDCGTTWYGKERCPECFPLG